MRPAITKRDSLTKRLSATSSMLSTVLAMEAENAPSANSVGGSSSMKELRRRVSTSRMSIPNSPRVLLPPMSEPSSYLLQLPANVQHQIVDSLDIEDAVNLASTYSCYTDLQMELVQRQEKIAKLLFNITNVVSLPDFSAAIDDLADLCQPVQLDHSTLHALSQAVWDEYANKSLSALANRMPKITPLVDVPPAIKQFCEVLIEIHGGTPPLLETNWGQFYARLSAVQNSIKSAPVSTPMPPKQVKRDLERALVFCSLASRTPTNPD
jgi:hypothetical protein